MTSHAAHKPSGGAASAVGRAFRRHVRSHSRRPHRRGAGRAAAVSSRRDLFHSLLAPAAQIAARTDAIRSSLRHGGAGLRRSSGFVPSLAEAPTAGVATARFLHDRHRAQISPRASRRSSLFHARRRPVSRDPTWKNYESLLDSCDFIIASRPGFPPGRIAPGDSAGKVRPHGPGARRQQDRAAQIGGPPADHRGKPRLLHRNSRAARAEANASTGLCPRAWRNTFSGRPCTGDQ